MGNVKKIARPINKVKNRFIKWLENKKAECIEDWQGDRSNEWDYYRHVSGFIEENLYSVYFTIWHGNVKIDFSDDENRYQNMTIEEFEQMIFTNTSN